MAAVYALYPKLSPDLIPDRYLETFTAPIQTTDYDKSL